MKVGNYHFELKNFKFIEALSDDSNCFSAILCVNNIKVADCSNSGHGGPTDISFYSKYQKNEQDIKDFLKTQPKIKFDNCNIELKFDLEYIVDSLVVEILDAKEFQRIMNKTKKYLVFKDTKGRFFTIGWKNETIASMLTKPQFCDALKKSISKELANGNTLLNDNIPAKLLLSECKK